MFARLTRLPLRRCIHTQTTRPTHSRFTRAALGASAATAAYLAWRSLAEPIALDSPTTIPSVHRTTVSSKPPPPKVSLSSPPSDSTSETPFIPESEPSSERPITSSSNRDGSIAPDNKQEGTKEEQEGEVKEGEQQETSGSAYNPQTGEINWDCPCLGGMAHGPCGPEFREAFSCFVFSEQDPKGIDCVEKFQAMQNCFRAHPEIYSDEIMDDDEDEGAPATDAIPAAAKSGEDASSSTPAPPHTQPPDTTSTSS